MKKASHLIQALPIYILYAIFKVLPLDAASKLGALMGSLLGRIVPENGRALENLRHVYPDRPVAFYRAIIGGMWNNLGRTLGELPHVKKIAVSTRVMAGEVPPEVPAAEGASEPARVRVFGTEFIKPLMSLDGADDDKRGALLISAHLGNWEICSAVFAHLTRRHFYVIHRVMNNPLVERLLHRARIAGAEGLHFLPKGARGGIALAKALRDGEVVGILTDQRLNEGIDVPFLGFMAKTLTTTAELALRYNVPIIPMQVVRRKKSSSGGVADPSLGAYFDVVYHPPIPTEGKSVYDITCACNDIVGSWVREHPEQWFWLHRRWKFPASQPTAS